MPTIAVQLETPLVRTFRVEQVAGLLDVPLPERIGHSLTAEVPGRDEAWTIGAIVGASGSGKTTLARAAFGEIYQPPAWPDELPIIECLERGAGVSPALDRTGRPEARPTIKQLVRVLTAVGLGGVRTWLKPYHVLSTGERFRADVARAIQESGVRSQESVGVLVLDEFTSALDRTIAKTASAALARLLRSSNGSPSQVPPGRRDLLPRLVVLACHDDILPWLAPDWVVELSGAANPCRDRPPG